MDSRINLWGRFRRYWLGKKRIGYLFIFPSVFILFVFTIIPLISSFFISFTNLDIFLGQPDFTGIENFVRSITDERVINAFKNTFIYVVISIPIQMILALVLAYWLSGESKFCKLCRSVYYIPVLCSFTAIGILFSLKILQWDLFHILFHCSMAGRLWPYLMIRIGLCRLSYLFLFGNNLEKP